MVAEIKDVVAGEEGSSLERNLQNRHIQLIAIGGAIGTGLFMGSGKTISTSGPSVLLVYAITGSVLFLFMRAMGELLLSNPGYASFADLAHDILGAWAGYVVGWTYWLCWIVTGMADLVAITSYIQFWWKDVPVWLPALVTIAVLFLLNDMTVGAFGETEFWFALIKIVAIISLVIVGAVFVIMHYKGSSVTNLWNHGGFFPHGFNGFIGGFQIAIFAFVGIELIGTTVAETKHPEKSLPKAINAIPVRVMLFYICALAAIMMVTPWNEIMPERSPFVTMFSLSGLAAAAAIVNIVVLTSAASSANSGVYSTSRMIYGLARRKDAPHWFRKLSKRHVPQNALILTAACLLLALIMLLGGKSIVASFTIFTSMAATLVMVIWSLITVAYIVYRRKHPELHEKSTFKLPLGKLSAYIILAFMVSMIPVLAIYEDTRVGLIGSVIWLVIILSCYEVHRRRKISKLNV